MNRADFQETQDQQSIDLFTLANSGGAEVSITNYGARMVALNTPDRDGNVDNILIGCSTLQEFLDDENYFGAAVGRCANRLANGLFSLDGENVQLETNEGDHHLHGGTQGFHQAVWEAKQIDGQTLKLFYQSEHKEGGYPGNLSVKITYKLTDDNKLHITSQAESDRRTILNMTYHPYFNLRGKEEGGSVYQHHLQLNADHFTPVDAELVPTGAIEPVKNTPLNFKEGKAIGKDIASKAPSMKFTEGYDHNMVLNKGDNEGPEWAATIEDDYSGRTMKIYTTEPALQFYVSKQPLANVDSAFCLEPQHYPDSPHHQAFPSIVQEAHTPYFSETIFSF